MTLTRTPGPLAPDPGPTNYDIDGPKHRLLLTPFPRRVRGELGGEVVIDTTAAFLLHETALHPQLYVPLADVRADALERTDHTTRCPFKGQASYRTVRVGDHAAENALWVYDEPLEAASWLRGLAGCYLNRLDRWLDEDQEVPAFLDPYHRFDVRPTSRHVVVRAGEEELVDTRAALLLSETSLPNRLYVPREAVRATLHGPTARATVCPYKGTATYWTVELSDGTRLENAAWSYQGLVGGRVCLGGERIEVLVDGVPAAS